MNEISIPSRGTPRRRLAVVGLGMAAVLAGGVATAVLASSGDTGAGPTGRAKLMAASEVLNRASEVAAAQPDLNPKPGQYLYFKSQSRQGGGATEIREIWMSVDGRHATLLADRTAGQPRTYRWICADRHGADRGGQADLAHQPKNCHDQPAYDPSLPKDAGAAKAWLYKNRDGSNPPDVQAFITVGDTIRERYIGSRSLAALFKAAAQIPGVQVYRDVRDSAGRTGIAVGQTWKHDRHELIFDPKTFRLIGEREVCDAAGSFHPRGESKTDPPMRLDCTNGYVGYSSAELAFGLVDRPARLP
jgi:hypothetical protein